MVVVKVAPLVKEVIANDPETVFSLDKPRDSIPNYKESIAHDEFNVLGTPDDGLIFKGWKNVLVGNPQGGVDPNFVPVFVQTEEGTVIELPNTVMDRIILNMSNTLVGIFFSLQPTIEMVRKWTLAKWRLKQSVSVSDMPGALFLFKFTTEEDVVMVLFGCWTYGKSNCKGGKFDLAICNIECRNHQINFA
ncbi:hypothetical protein SUGI_1172740 [Cryptomeria japonica]|nr:hypothetical protein SUGI_1172740 [Cryptomeria japonica]